MSPMPWGSPPRRAADIAGRLVNTAKLGIPDTARNVASDLYELLEGDK
ncbi:hypothetical protein [Streptomyces sp. OE57]